MSPRELSVTIAPHLQRALEVMGRDMAVEPQALVNQAVFAWLRINGYVLPGTIGDVVSVATAPVEAPVVAPVAAPAPVAVEPSPPPVAPPTAPETVAARPALVTDPHARPTAPEPPAATGTVPAVAPPPEPPAGLGAAVARIEEIEADLERFAKARPAFPEAADEAHGDEEEEEEEAEAQDEEAQDEDASDEGEPGDEDAASDEATAARGESLEDEEDDEPTRGVAPSDGGDEDGEEDEDEERAPEGTFVVKSVPVVLYIEREGEDAVRVESEHFIIGRGPSCDLIIDSPRVSREHVRVSRQGVTFVLEDLGSSNGTWYGEDRVERRELESGDELRLGNELVRFVLRGD